MGTKPYEGETRNERYTHCGFGSHTSKECWHLNPSKAPNWEPRKPCPRKNCRFNDSEGKKGDKPSKESGDYSMTLHASDFPAVEGVVRGSVNNAPRLNTRIISEELR